MKKLLMILTCCMTLALTACHQDNDDYITLATIQLDGGSDVTIERVQAMAHITNLNTKHVVSTADFTGDQVQIELLRGAYQVSIEGVLSYTDQTGNKHIRSFRAVSDYVELVGTGTSKATINIIYLD
ncbi:hypothetical protein SAMN04487826_2758 [Prevotella sp. khp1]|uniref:hypothetical protein n=1 Tax=Prevotellaceae TaxID=171552 RepID=UPI000886FD54|nr:MULTISPECIES: hypothetical protein [Prevotellaceae]QVJ82091.1 hypothetical protein J4031_07005 [Xylanibacter ruminicola]SDQ82641.1 hypothetical protein SAMN04487826_2758 [Prevotella sp. khp1]